MGHCFIGFVSVNASKIGYLTKYAKFIFNLFQPNPTQPNPTRYINASTIGPYGANLEAIRRIMQPGIVGTGGKVDSIQRRIVGTGQGLIRYRASLVRTGGASGIDRSWTVADGG